LTLSGLEKETSISFNMIKNTWKAFVEKCEERRSETLKKVLKGFGGFPPHPVSACAI